MDQSEREQKLEEAMDLYGDYIVQLCYTYVQNWQTAEDLAQDTFMRYFDALSNFAAMLLQKRIYFGLL